MNPGVDQEPAEWRRRVRDLAGVEGPVPPVSIWQGDADTRVVPRNGQELVEQWTAVHGIPPTPAHSERSGRITRELYTDGAGVTRVESVLVEGLGHAFPIHARSTSSCGQFGDFVVSAGVCTAREISRFWGLSGAN
jgi:poly(3-hydroxybutyrate) depolymerase